MRAFVVAAHYLLVLGGTGTAAFQPVRIHVGSSSASPLGKDQMQARSSLLRTPVNGAVQSGNVHSVMSSKAGSPLALSSFPVAFTSVANTILPPSASRLSRAFRLFALFFTTLMAISTQLRRRIFYPGLNPDPTKTESLPIGPSGCPFVGTPFFFNPSKRFGAGDFYRRISAKLGNPRVWRYYFMGQPFAVISGTKLKSVLSKEFDSITSSGVDLMDDGLMPMQSVLFEPDKSRHSFLRRLVGDALTPRKVSQAVPTLQKAAEEQVRRMLSAGPSENIQMAKICNDYTLDVAWRQILGLDLSEEEIPQFEKAVEEWIKGMMSLRVLFRIAVKSSPGYKAMLYITSKIEEKMKKLEKNGPDTSTLSGMLFARDEEDPSKTLTREEVVDNAKILIFAGSETSASTLTNAMLFLGLHRGAWNKLVEEQLQMRERHGDVLTKSHLDDECPYLEAVIKESMRMRTVSGGIPRRTTETIIVGGEQIPKGWLIDPSPLLTHELDPVTQEEGSSHMDPVMGFCPERWLNTETKPSDSYIPFGFGPRYCLGSNLAMAEMKVFLAVLARNISYKLDREDNIEWSRDLTVIAKPVDGVQVTVKASEQNFMSSV